MIQTACALCGSNSKYKIIYKGNFSNSDLNTNVFSARRLPDGSHYQMVKCNNDGLVRSNPVLESSIISKLYKDSKFTYEDEIVNLEKTYMEVLFPVLSKLFKKDNILEIGCGNGFILTKLQELGYSNCYGIEPSEEATSKANKNIRKNIVVDVLRPNIFQNKKFKLIFFFQTLDHIPNPNKFLTECHRLLEDKGYILAFNHNIESLSARILGEQCVIIDIEHIFLFSPKTIKSIFEKNNLRPLKIFSPFNTISLKYLIQLLPLPVLIKRVLLALSPYNINLRLQLGNLCIIAQK